MLHPRGVDLELIDHHDLAERSPGKSGSSVTLKWAMPTGASATWTFGAHGDAENGC